jgi:hypothetical protein
MSEQRKTESSAPEQQHRRAAQLAPKPYPQKRPYDYYAAHPEHRPRPLPPRVLRRRRIREG